MNQPAPPTPQPGDRIKSAICNPQSKIRLVHCIGTMRLGGAEKQLAELICRLPRDRFEQSLVLLQGGGPLIDRVRAAGCEVIELGYQQKFRKWDVRCWAAMGHALGQFLGHLRRRRPHILHAQLYWANILSVIAGRLARVPVIITSRRQLSAYKQGRPLLQKMEDLANRFTTAVVVNSEAVRHDVLHYEKINPAIIHRIYNGVILDNFKTEHSDDLRAQFNLTQDDLVIMVIANLHPYKGHEDLLESMTQLTSKYPHLKAILPGRDSGAGSRLKKQVKALNLEGHVQWLGERHDIPLLLTLADVVIHPSHEEGFCNSILEAMAAGRPMIVTNVGGCPEQVIPGVNGFVIPPRDPSSLSIALDQLLGDPQLRQTMGQASRQRIETLFDFKTTVENYKNLYESMMDRITPDALTEHAHG